MRILQSDWLEQISASGHDSGQVFPDRIFHAGTCAYEKSVWLARLAHPSTTVLSDRKQKRTITDQSIVAPCAQDSQRVGLLIAVQH